jgi:hypothetical protein
MVIWANYDTESFFLTGKLIKRALDDIKLEANIIFNDQELSGGSKFGVLVARIKGIPVGVVIIGDENEANNNLIKLQYLLGKANWALNKAANCSMTITEIFKEHSDNIERGDFLFVGSAVEPESNIFVAVCATENSNVDDMLAQDFIDQIKELIEQARDEYIAKNPDKLKDRI